MRDEPPDFTQLDDTALINLRAEMRAALAQLSPRSPDYSDLARAYDASTAEMAERARRAWTRAG